MFLPPETQYVRSVDGVHIAYQVTGNGPDVLLLDAWVMPLEARWRHDTFARPLQRLASFARLISFDKRGVGLSDPVALDVGTLEAWAEDILTVLDATGSERPVIVGTHDGGMAAMLFATTHPERVSGLILLNTSARVARDPTNPFGIPRATMDQLTARAIAEYGSVIGASATRAFAGDPDLQVWWAAARRHQASPRTFIAMMDLQLEADLRPILPTIQVPTLVLHRVDDAQWGIEHGRLLAAHIEGGRLVELAGADHTWQAGDVNGVIDEVEAFVTGDRPPASSDRILATMLFIDIVASTERAVALGDHDWGRLLGRFRAEMRQQLDRFRGREVNTRGDDLLATFDGPARAVRCALAMVEAARAMGVEVCCGVHTGEVERLGDDDIGGIAVHVAARVQAAATAGQVLVSRTVVDLIAGSGIDCTPAGDHELKGVPGSHPLFVAG